MTADRKWKIVAATCPSCERDFLASWAPGEILRCPACHDDFRPWEIEEARREKAPKETA